MAKARIELGSKGKGSASSPYFICRGGGKRVSLSEKAIRSKKSGNEICYSNSSILLVKMMMCSKLRSPNSIFISESPSSHTSEVPLYAGNVAESSASPCRPASLLFACPFRCGFECKVHRLLYHSTLGLRVIKKQEGWTRIAPGSHGRLDPASLGGN